MGGENLFGSAGECGEERRVLRGAGSAVGRATINWTLIDLFQSMDESTQPPIPLESSVICQDISPYYSTSFSLNWKRISNGFMK